MKRLLTSLVSLTVALGAGCGIGPHVDDYNDALVAAALATCTCGGLTYGSEDKCRAEYPPDSGDLACIEALFKNADADYEPHLDCRTAAGNRYVACMNSSKCTDILGRGACVLQLADEIEDCPKFSAEVQRDHDQCLD